MRRKIVSLMMVVILLLSGVVFSAAPKSSAASVVTVNKKSVTVKKGKTIKVTFSTKKQLSLSASVVAGEDNVSFKWGKWKTKKKTDSVDLKIKGVNPGKARIMVSNTLNKKKIYINVKITGKKNFETKEDNINRLKQYIISNGKTDEDDDGKQYYYCTFSGEEIADDLYLIVRYYMEDGSINLIYLVDGEVTSMGTLKCQSDMCGLASYEYVLTKPSMVMTSTNIIIETIQKNDSFDFDISWPIDPSNKIRDTITSMSNSSIHMLLSSFNHIFLRHFGFSMNEIGFNSYV